MDIEEIGGEMKDYEKKLDEFSKLEKGWDSDGYGKPITKKALKTAKYLLEGAYIAPQTNGGILITIGPEEEITIDIWPDGEYSISTVLKMKEDDEGTTNS